MSQHLQGFLSSLSIFAVIEAKNIDNKSSNMNATIRGVAVRSRSKIQEKELII